VNRAGLLGFGVTAIFGILVSLAIWPARAVNRREPYATSAPVIAMAAPGLAIACLFFTPTACSGDRPGVARAGAMSGSPSFTT